ncbi:hypothetical protein GCM10007063_16880 [Lentibacillus kapialis]|uniref:Uncharacterized protein n=1 Tax=Lentibacillus kapialis TaxID=340214 RepID=A0A917PWI8_9BACI|nr:hypothetical protein GCM10007063_16880 [Lentibacillus kapialis]
MLTELLLLLEPDEFELELDPDDPFEPSMLSFWPIRIKSDDRLFQFFSWRTDTPYSLPSADSESPDLTV